MRPTKDQLEALLDRVRPMLSYFGRLEQRMIAAGFQPDDKLLRMVHAAHDDLHRLAVELHYRSCEGGVGRED